MALYTISKSALAGAPATKPPVQCILGTMTMGWKNASQTVDDTVSQQMLERFSAAGHREIDTAIVYADGETERILGRVMGNVEV